MEGEVSNRSKWTTLQESSLIEMVLAKESLLFGELKGPGAKGINKKRAETWDEITHSLNAQFLGEKRDVEKVRKKFFNLRQRAKEKIDDIKKSMKKTGGGPALPPLTESECLLADAMSGRPFVHGIEGGIDTDEQQEQDDGDLAKAKDSTKSDDVVVIEKELKKESKKKKTRNQNEPEVENMLEDTKRIKLEQRKLELELEVLEEKKKNQVCKREVYEAKKIYYFMKMQNEFGVEISDVTVQSKEQ